MRILTTAMAALLLGACASATSRIPGEALGVSARDGYVEARSVARSWDTSARLRYVEGEGIGADGLAGPQGGLWRFHYTAPDKSDELVVEVTPLETESAERPATSPPGFVIGDNALGTSWIDSGEVVEAIVGAGGAPGAPLSMLLVPARPEQWLVRPADREGRWRIHAETGEVLER
jgi:hypothetical protein